MKAVVRWPVWLCPFRPFFVLLVLVACGFMALWLASLQGWPGQLSTPGGWLFWHAHEMLFAFAGAATAGFALTAIPEFTASRFLSRRPLLLLVLVWLAARLAWPAGIWLGMIPAQLLNLLFWLILLRHISPPIWQDPGRRQISFILVLLLLAFVQQGFFLGQYWHQDALSWLRLAGHSYMLLVILAASRVSMSVVNNLVEAGRNIVDAQAQLYLARPPRRNLAIFCIAVHAASEFWLAGNQVSGWTALAAMAAIFHLLNDWHIGKALLRRFSLLLYLGYWLLALGYALLGAAYLGAPLLPSAGRHLLLAGSMSLVIFCIMCIVARIHSGLWLDRRPWLPQTATLLALSAILRASAGFYPLLGWYNQLLWLSGLLWLAAFFIYGCKFFPILLRARADNRAGCAEPAVPD